jgi:hypothetical protein
MKTLQQLLRLRNKYEGALFGVEIETEGAKLPDRVPVGWSIKEDGSLRGRFPDQAAEYVSTVPLRLEDSIASVQALRRRLDDNDAELAYSFRTSVHVHLNVTDLTSDQYLNVIYTYLLLENVFVRYCGNERIANRFCLRYQDAEELGEFLSELFRNGAAYVANADLHRLKYAAINVAATPRYGSLEFRAMQGNLEVEYITNWLRAINNVREFAVANDNPQAIHDKFVKLGPTGFMQAVLKNLYPCFSYEGEEGDLQLAFSITIELPHVYQNEKIRLERVEKQIKKEREDMLDRVEREIRARKQRALAEAGLIDVIPEPEDIERVPVGFNPRMQLRDIDILRQHVIADEIMHVRNGAQHQLVRY